MLIIFMKYPPTIIIEAHEKFIEHAKQKNIEKSSRILF